MIALYLPPVAPPGREAFFANRLGEGAVEILDGWRTRLAGPKGVPTAREDLLLQACGDL